MKRRGTGKNDIMHKRQLDILLRWERKRVDRRRDHAVGKTANYLGPSTYAYRERLNKLADTAEAHHRR